MEERLQNLSEERGGSKEKEQILIREMRIQVVKQLDTTKEVTDEELYACIDEVLMMQEYRKRFSVRLRMQFRQALYDSFRRLDVLSEALDDPEVTEIMVNGYDQI